MKQQLAVPARAVGGFFEMMIETGRATFRRPFQWSEFLDQTWMIARVSLVPTLLVSIPFTVLVAFTLNILLREIGAADLSGAGTAFGTVTQLGPVVTVLTGLRELVLAEVKALLFGVMAGMVGCYRGLTVKGGPKGVGNAVNETVVYAFICLFVINVVMTAIGVKVTAK